MKKPNILVLVPIYYPHYGGAEKAIFELYKGLSKDYNIDLLCPNFGSDKVIENNSHFTIHRICNQTKSKIFKTFKYQYYFIKYAKKLAKQKKYSLIHTHYTFPTGVSGLILKKKFNVPLVITEHHYGTGMDISSHKKNPKILNSIMKYIAKKATLMVSTGKTQDKFLTFLKVKKFKTIELGGDCSISKESNKQIIKDLKLDSNKKYLLNVSRLEKRKKTEELIYAIKNISKKNPNIHLLIGGKGTETNYLKKIIKELKISKNVSLLGFVSDEDLEKYRKISTAFITASEFEGAGIMYLEAFCSKLPLFAKKNVASESIITNKKNGLLFNTSKELEELLITYLNDSKTLDPIKNNAFELFKDKYNWNTHCSKYNTLYKNLIKNG